MPYAPVSHPFVERLIGTIREELLDQVLFWNLLDLERKLTAFQTYYNRYRVHSGIGGRPPEQAQEQRLHRTIDRSVSFGGCPTATAYSSCPLPRSLIFRLLHHFETLRKK